MINIFCIKYGSKYGVEYVNKLQSMIESNTNLDHRFICLTDSDEGIFCETIKIKTDDFRKKLFHKITLLEESQKFKEDCAFFDLDVIIQNNIDDYMKPSDKLKLINKPWVDTKSLIKELSNNNKTIPSVLNSSVMTWKPHTVDPIIKKYYSSKYIGESFDRFLLKYCYKDFDLYKNPKIYSFAHGYKYPHDIEERVYRSDLDICLFNGTKNEHYLYLDFVMENWGKK